MDLTGVRIKCSNCKKKSKALDMNWSNGAGESDEARQPYEKEAKDFMAQDNFRMLNTCPHCGSARWKRIKAFKI